MVAIDTNILVAAHRRGAPHHEEALALLKSLAEDDVPFALFWPSLYEFLRVVTHHRVFDPPSTPREALEALEDFLAPPAVRVLSETPAHLALVRRVISEAGVTGNLVHDGHLVALALEHGAHEILTLDADFRRFPHISSRNPFA
jgi:toxin-antitoxin system PIN domain toxin